MPEEPARGAPSLGVHLAVSILKYRQVMRREWPKVEPIEGDDEWGAA